MFTTVQTTVLLLAFIVISIDAVCNPATTCSGHGTCNGISPNGVCLCNEGWDDAPSAPPYCSVCALGWQDGVCGQCCECIPLFVLNSGTCWECSGNGIVLGGVCICGPTFTGALCNECLPGYFPNNVNLLLDAGNFPVQCCPGIDSACSSWGTCEQVGSALIASCVCVIGITGAGCSECSNPGPIFPACTIYNYCTFTNNCNNNGACNYPAMTCHCSGNFAGAACTQCIANHYNPYAGCNTVCIASTTCNGHGACDSYTGACDCRANYIGTSCNACAANYYSYPNCTFCFPSSSCRNLGTCNSLGQCDCTAQYAGPSCNTCSANHYLYPTCVFCSRAVTCNNHGSCNSLGHCSCDVGYTGAACAACSTGYSGYPACTGCFAPVTCNALGTCRANFTCDCFSIYGGASCETCAVNHFNYPVCTHCLAATTCNGNGYCSSNGFCTCNPTFAGFFCDSCIANFYAYPDCTYCLASTNCTNSQGVCSLTIPGGCDCNVNYGGAHCNECATGTFTVYPQCSTCALPIVSTLYWSLNVSAALLANLPPNVDGSSPFTPVPSQLLACVPFFDPDVDTVFVRVRIVSRRSESMFLAWPNIFSEHFSSPLPEPDLEMVLSGPLSYVNEFLLQTQYYYSDYRLINETLVTLQFLASPIGRNGGVPTVSQLTNLIDVSAFNATVMTSFNVLGVTAIPASSISSVLVSVLEVLLVILVSVGFVAVFCGFIFAALWVQSLVATRKMNRTLVEDAKLMRQINFR